MGDLSEERVREERLGVGIPTEKESLAGDRSGTDQMLIIGVLLWF